MRPNKDRDKRVAEALAEGQAALQGAKVATIWERQLSRTKEGSVKKLGSNIVLVLTNAPDWAGAIGFDDFAERIMIRKACPAGEPGPWTDNADKLTAIWLQRSKWQLEASYELVASSIETVARKNTFHPLRDRLNALVWDGNPRVDTWTSKYLGAEDSLVHVTMGVRWLLGAVRRAFEPGCQMDAAIILEGPQGRGKSSALRILSLGFFTDELSDVGSKDASMQLHGCWIVEIAELDAISRADAAKVKAFLTRRVDRFRAPYGRHVAEHPRQCVFAGSVNHNDYLRDETGGRRFWPIACGRIDLEALKRDVEQLWAESVQRYRNGECTYIDDVAIAAEVAAHTSERYQGDAWQDVVLAYAQVRESVSIQECLEHVGVERGHWSQQDSNRIAKILKAQGYVRRQMTIGGKKSWRYGTDCTTCGARSGSHLSTCPLSEKPVSPVEPVL
jgi:putative DNA primase/helicase